MNQIGVNFKEMPVFLKLLLLLSVYSFIENFISLIQFKPVTFDYFDSGFPKNFPVIWYLYYLGYNAWTLIVYFNRSYLQLKKYIFFSLFVVLIAFLNILYKINQLPQDQIFITLFVYGITFILGIVIFVYLYKLKNYFNKP